jgi:hypothetical protein
MKSDMSTSDLPAVGPLQHCRDILTFHRTLVEFLSFLEPSSCPAFLLYPSFRSASFLPLRETLLQRLGIFEADESVEESDMRESARVIPASDADGIHSSSSSELSFSPRQTNST